MSLVCGGTAGLISSTLTFPLDLIRRRMQLEGQAGARRQAPSIHVVMLLRTMPILAPCCDATFPVSASAGSLHEQIMFRGGFFLDCASRDLL